LSRAGICLIEYLEAIASAMEAEKARYEAHLTQLIGMKITLA
jgi:hypothetical protein